MHEFKVSTTPADLIDLLFREKSETDFVIEKVFGKVQRKCEKGEQFPSETHCCVTAEVYSAPDEVHVHMGMAMWMDDRRLLL